MNTPRTITPKEARARLKCSRRHFKRLMDDRRFTFERVNARVINIHVDSFENFVRGVTSEHKVA